MSAVSWEGYFGLARTVPPFVRRNSIPQLVFGRLFTISIRTRHRITIPKSLYAIPGSSRSDMGQTCAPHGKRVASDRDRIDSSPDSSRALRESSWIGFGCATLGFVVRFLRILVGIESCPRPGWFGISSASRLHPLLDGNGFAATSLMEVGINRDLLHDAVPRSRFSSRQD